LNFDIIPFTSRLVKYIIYFSYMFGIIMLWFVTVTAKTCSSKGALMTKHIRSRLIHPKDDGDPRFGDVVAPIHLTTTYAQEAFGQPLRYDYSRGGNPSRQVVEDQIAALEGGSAGLAFASGMAAITAVLSLFKPGDELLIPNNIYGGSFRILERYFKPYGLNYRFVNVSNSNAVAQALAQPNLPKPAAIFFESPTNPLLEVADIAAIAKLAHQSDTLVIVDNTFLTPYLQRPLELGADIVLHSATKYLGGHSDVLAGLVAVKDKLLYNKLHFIQYSTGGVLSPFDSYLLTRGIKTLAVRMDCAQASALAIANWLKTQPQVSRVIYPGLPEHPGYQIQQKQASGAGALLAFELQPQLDTQKMVQRLELITLAESLGAVESLICHPATMTHASIPAALRAQMGINDTLLRLSVGIEHVDDLIADLGAALAG
jgi:cystathionine beta-lyase/cystathionine gamma-synthase